MAMNELRQVQEKARADIALNERRDVPAQVLAREFYGLRAHTEEICAHLEIEDHVVQPAPFVSPPKWHLAHTTWFFARFVLEQDGAEAAGMPDDGLLFNSYYKSQGSHWRQEERGRLSRPTVRQVMDYRRRVTEKVMETLGRGSLTARQREIVAIGLQHEMQHQELLLMDIKYIFAGHPAPPAYEEVAPPALAPAAPLAWLEFGETIAEFGAAGAGFAYDNEKPRHRVWLNAFRIADRMVTNGEYLDFIEEGGYSRPELWLSDGWDWLRANEVGHPLYWRRREGRWLEYQLAGLRPLQREMPVSHVSYYEAEAYARWREARLPTEYELEFFLRRAGEARPQAFWAPGEPLCPLPGKAADRYGNGLLWQWTRSAYSPYPGFVPENGALGEYNGKFMSDRFVLKGGCVATPRGHLRPSYRNFYRACDRWPFTGIRLARDCP